MIDIVGWGGIRTKTFKRRIEEVEENEKMIYIVRLGGIRTKTFKRRYKEA